MAVDREALGLPPRAADEGVEARAVAAVDALFELGVDVQGHLGVGVADLAHDPLDVEVVGEQRDRDVRAAQAVRRGVGQRRQAARDESLAGELGGLADDLADALAGQPSAVQVGHEVVLGAGRRAAAAQPVDVLDDRLDQVGAELHLADARLGLRVGDAEAGAVGVVQTHLADPQRAQLARAHAGAAEDLAHHPTADVAAADLGARAAQVIAHGRLRHPELIGDLARALALREHLRDERRGRRKLRLRAGGQRAVLIGGRGGARDTDDSQLPAVPTRMDFLRDPITIKRGGNTTVWVEIDAKNGYLPDHEDDLTVSFDARLGGKVTDVAKSRLLGGRSLWRLQAATDAPLGDYTIDAILVTASGVITTSATVKVVEPAKTKKRTITTEEPDKGPVIKWMRRDSWDGLGWDAQTVGEVRVRPDETLILLNRDQRLLERALDRNKKLTKEQIQTRESRYLFPVACALYEQYDAAKEMKDPPTAEYVKGELERLAEAVLLVIDQDAFADRGGD